MITIMLRNDGELLLLFGDGICKAVSWEAMRVSASEMTEAGTRELGGSDRCGLDGK